MAEEKKDPIQLLADKRGVAREIVVQELRELDLGQKQPDGKRSGGFAELYEKGIFAPATFEGDRVAHEAFGKALGSDQDLFRAFDHYKKINSGGKGVQEILKEAGDSYGAGARRSINELMPWAGDIEGEFNQFLYGPYGFVPLANGTYAEPWRKEQAQEEAGIKSEESDADRKERERKEEIERMRAEKEEQKAQAQAIALDRDPEARMLRMQNAQAQNNPFLFGTEGVSAQTDRLLDIAGREKPFRNYSDRRMRADMDSRAFVARAARENIRELDRLDRGRRATVDNNFENMMQWTVNNPEHEMAKKGPNNWTDQEKIKFVQALNLGKINLDAPAAAAPAPAAQAPVTAREVPIEAVKKSPMIQPPPGMPVEMTVNERFPKQPTLDEPDSALPPQDPFKSKPAYTAENAQQDYNKIKAMRDLDEAKRVNQINSQIQLTNMQKSKAQNIADTKAYHNQTVPTYGKRNDGTYGVMYDPRSPQAMKERSIVMQGINNSKSGDMFQDIMDSSKEEDERKRRQQQFVTASKNSPYYTNYFGS